jgi:hypothetical protein
MSFGGSVQAMIESLRANGRSRPSLRKSFHREVPRLKLSVEKRITKIPSAADQQRIREKLVYYKTEYRKKVVKQLVVTALVVIVLAFLGKYIISLLQESPDYFFHGIRKDTVF